MMPRTINGIVKYYAMKMNQSVGYCYGALYGEIDRRLKIDLYEQSKRMKVSRLKAIQILGIESKALNIAQEIFKCF